MSFKERYANLNTRQRSAVDSTEGPLMVIAGPGSGKTEVLGMRIANIIKKTDTPPGSVLCLTYTDAASVNMRERLIDLIGEEAYRVSVYTFHAFCKKIIENHPEYFYKGVSFNLATRVTQTGIIEKLLNELDYSDPLSGFHPKLGFAYLRDIEKRIFELKEEGISPEDFQKIIEKNEIFFKKIESKINNVFKERVSKKTFLKIENLIDDLEKIKEEEYPLGVTSINKEIAFSLKKILKEGSIKEISKWKSKRIIKKNEKFVLKDAESTEKMKSFSRIYEKYQEEMRSAGYYDFSDMILDVIKEMEKNEDLCSLIKEKYLYVLVDEFQDTSGVQMRFLNLLFKDDQDKNPNIFTVADDDQAIYRFRGAEIANILRFKESYPKTKIVVLKENYRSVKEILDFSYNTIKKGEERLENYFPEIKKRQTTNKKNKGNIFYKEFRTEEEEFSFLVKEIEKEIKKTSPEKIAVIGRTHNTIKKAISFFPGKKIPVYAERKENVLEKKHINEIITIIRFAKTLLDGNNRDADSFLPEILTYPFWGIKREEVWKISVMSYEKNMPWIECMKRRKETSCIADFLLDLSLRAKNSSAEELIDIIIGNKKGIFLSSFKQYYFSRKEFKNNKENYLSLLSSLKCFIKATREYKIGRSVMAKDLIEFVDLLEKNNIPLLDKNPLISNDSAVSFITAHSAKGREYDCVFVLNCNQGEWAKTRSSNKISLPLNMPFEKEANNRDDHLRLFYVTMTRAKEKIYFISHKKEEKRENIPLEFIEDLKKTREKISIEENKRPLSQNEIFSFSRKEKDYIFPLVEKYKISATGLTKFLNVEEGGPTEFFDKNILRFPEKKSFSLSYGTAIHEAISSIYNILKKEGKVISEKEFISIFKKALIKERLPEKDFKKGYKKGKEALSIFYKKRKKDFISEYEIEKNFNYQNCFVGDIEITGKIDKMIKKDNEIEVTDIKTGKSLKNFNGVGDYEKIKAWKYRNQLIFYKILIESARDYKGKYNVNRGILEFVEPNNKKEIVTLLLEIDNEEAERLRNLISIIGKKIKKLDFPSTKEYKGKGIRGIREFEEDIIKGKI